MDAAAQLIDRGPVLATIRRALATEGRLVLHGATGIGKSTMFRQLIEEQSLLSLAAHPKPETRPFKTVVDLLNAVDEQVTGQLPPQWRHTLAALRTKPEPPGDRIAVQLAVLEVLQLLSRSGRILLAVDDAQWMDAESRNILRFALRNLRPTRLSVLLASDQAGLASLIGGGCLPIPVPPWTVSELSELLADQGLPSRFAGRIHQSCGGNPALALRIGSVIAAPRPTAEPPETPQAHQLASRQLSRLTIRARHTLLIAALADKPTAGLLRRTGRRHARQDLDAAIEAELISVSESGVIRFSAGVIADALSSGADAEARAAGHRALAEAETDPTAVVWHRALAEDEVSAQLSSELEQTAVGVDRSGDPGRAARLAMLAADRTPQGDSGARLRRYLAAAGYASLAADTRLTQDAASAALNLVTEPADRVRVQLTLIEVAGQALDSIETVLADAWLHAAGHPELLAELELWRAWRAHICDADANKAIEHAESAIRLAVEAGVRKPQIEALTTVARLKLVRGDGGTDELLDRAERLYDPENPISVNMTAQFVRGRQALFEDRLGDARQRFQNLLPLARRLGRVTGLIEVLRSLAEVELRAGRCRLAKDYSHQAMRYAAGSETSTGAPWYVAALTEAASGSLDRAQRYARQGLRSSREDHDILFTTRNLFALGRIQLMCGQPDKAVESLLKVQSLESTNELIDPSVLQWHGELVEALAGVGRLTEANAVLADGRAAATRFNRANVTAQLDRAEAAVRLADGDTTAAAALLSAADRRFEELRLPLEAGRTRLAAARLERGRQREAAARRALDAASATFEDCGADVWQRLAAGEQALLREAFVSGSALTAAESKVAELVAEGASNRQTAEALFVSVKTIEATLTRVYRKLGVRSRSQLSTLLGRERTT